MLTAADARTNTSSANYKAGYNAGYNAGKAIKKTVNVSCYNRVSKTTVGRTEISIITVNGTQIASGGPYENGEFTISGSTSV